MGLLDGILGAVLGGGQQQQQNPLLGIIMTMLSQQGGGGGLGGLVQAFQQKGMGDIVNSWIGTGQNLPISVDQLKQVLGQEQVQQMAQQTGMDHGDLLGQLSLMLPLVVDQVTPQGAMPEQSSLEQVLGGLLSGLQRR